MDFGRRARFMKNKAKLLYYSNSYIDRFAREYDSFHSTDKKNIIKQISDSIDANYDSLSTVDEDDEWFIQEAVAYISHATYDLLFTDYYDLGGTYVNPVGYRSLWGMHERALNWALEHGLITQEDIDEDKAAYAADRRSR